MNTERYHTPFTKTCSLIRSNVTIVHIKKIKYPKIKIPNEVRTVILFLCKINTRISKDSTLHSQMDTPSSEIMWPESILLKYPKINIYKKRVTGGDPITKMAAYRRNKHAADGSSSSYLNNEKSHRQRRWMIIRSPRSLSTFFTLQTLISDSKSLINDLS